MNEVCNRKCSHSIYEKYEHRGHRRFEFCSKTGKRFDNFNDRPTECEFSTVGGEDGSQDKRE